MTIEVIVMNESRTQFALVNVPNLRNFLVGGQEYTLTGQYGAHNKVRPLFMPVSAERTQFVWFTDQGRQQSWPYQTMAGCLVGAAHSLRPGDRFRVKRHKRPGRENILYEVVRKGEARLLKEQGQPFNRLTGEVERTGLIVR